MKTRIATPSDADDIRRIHLSAFSDDERELVSKLAVDLLLEEALPPVFSLFCEIDGAVVGHIAFSPVMTNDTRKCLGYILAPLAVSPDFQNRGVGSLLVRNGVKVLPEPGTRVILVYGDPRYYGRFGFRKEEGVPYTPPYELTFPEGWLGLVPGDFDERPTSVEISCVTSLCHPNLW